MTKTRLFVSLLLLSAWISGLPALAESGIAIAQLAGANTKSSSR